MVNDGNVKQFNTSIKVNSNPEVLASYRTYTNR